MVETLSRKAFKLIQSPDLRVLTSEHHSLRYSLSGIGNDRLFSMVPRSRTPAASRDSFALHAVRRRVLSALMRRMATSATSPNSWASCKRIFPELVPLEIAGYLFHNPRRVSRSDC